jgi:hypothetical protein
VVLAKPVRNAKTVEIEPKKIGNKDSTIIEYTEGIRLGRRQVICISAWNVSVNKALKTDCTK